MRSKGIYKGLVKSFDTDRESGNFFDLRKSFRDIAIALNVPFYDHCCPLANTTGLVPVGFNTTTAVLSYFNPVSGAVVTIGDAQSVTALTAFAGGGQGSAVALAQGFNEVTTVATAGDSVKLPLAAEGMTVIVKNDGATAADVFPGSADTINDGVADTAIRIAPGNVIIFRAINATNWETDREKIAVTDGTVGAPSYSFNTQPNMGVYKISSTQLGFAVSGALAGGVNATGFFADHITEQTTGVGVSFDKNTIQKRTATAVNITGSILAAAVAGGLVTSTSAAAVTATLDTATAIGTQIGAVQGTTIDFVVDNIAGANTVTVAVNTGITAITAVITGGATLTVASGTAGQFRLYFTSATVAKLARIF